MDEAVCIVPRTRALNSEYHRKVRTMLRGLNTLWHMRSLLNPFRYGRFAWMLMSHKVSRWLGFLTLPLAGVGVLLLAPHHPAGWLGGDPLAVEGADAAAAHLDRLCAGCRRRGLRRLDGLLPRHLAGDLGTDPAGASGAGAP